MAELVSIIVPVYNVKKYLNKCIRSLLNQTYENIEILLINDGSSDGSEEICESFSNSCDTIHYINQPNMGVSVARNAGLDNARGDYIMFVDSDDWLPYNSVQDLVQTIRKDDADIGIADFWMVSSIRGYSERYSIGKVIDRINCEDFANAVLKLDGRCCGKIFRSSIINKESIRFDSSLKWGEDASYLADYLKCCQRLSFYDGIVYCYNLLNANSATKKYRPEYNIWFLQCYRKYDEIYDSMPLISGMKEIRMKSLAFYFQTSCSHYANNPECLNPMEKIMETYNMYRPYIDFDACERIGFTVPNLLEESQFDEVISILKTNKENENQISNLLRGIISKIRLLYYYRIVTD